MKWYIASALLSLVAVADLLGGPSHASPDVGTAATPIAAASDVTTSSRAIAIARAHVAAWSRHDYAAARRMLADDVHVVVSAPDAGMGRTDTMGVDRYMEGLKRFASAVTPGSAHVIAAAGDDRHALILLELKAALGPGPVKTLTAARLYQIDAKGRIQDEEVAFYVTP